MILTATECTEHFYPSLCLSVDSVVNYDVTPVLTIIRIGTIYFKAASSSASIRSTGFHITTHRFVVSPAAILDLLVDSKGVGEVQGCATADKIYNPCESV